MPYLKDNVSVTVHSTAAVNSYDMVTAIEAVIDQRIAALFGVDEYNTSHFLQWLQESEAIRNVKLAYDTSKRIGG